MYVNKVGPYSNPHETYHYYSLPVCHPEKVKQTSPFALEKIKFVEKKIVFKELTLGEVLSGDRMAYSLYDVKFNGESFLEKMPEKLIYFSEKVENRKLCQSQLNTKDFEMLREAIEEHYYFEFVIDDIPIRNFLGYLEETNIFPHKHNIYLYAHYHFDFFINNNQVNTHLIN